MKKYKQAFKVQSIQIKLILKITTFKWHFKPFLDDEIIYKIKISEQLFPQDLHCLQHCTENMLLQGITT